MVGFALLAILLDRTALSLRLVAWSAVIVLAVAPESLTGASFQMSFAAVVALIAAWEAAAGWRRRLHERADRARHCWLWRLAAAIAASLATTLIASIATGAFAAFQPPVAARRRCQPLGCAAHRRRQPALVAAPGSATGSKANLIII